MDMTEEYYKMCEKATEIQKVWIRSNKDYWTWTESTLSKMLEIGCAGLYEKKENMIWLPRQDQLQEMLIGDGIDGTYVSVTSPQGNTNYKYGFTEILLRRCLLNKFHQWCNNNEYHVGFRFHTPFDMFESMEQLWLAFVMEEKNKKTWDGEDWI